MGKQNTLLVYNPRHITPVLTNIPRLIHILLNNLLHSPLPKSLLLGSIHLNVFIYMTDTPKII